MKDKKDVKLNTSSKYKHNKFQIKYLKYKNYNMVLFANYEVEWDKEDNIFYRVYDFFIYFNRNKRTIYYIGNNSAYKRYGFISNNNISSFMNSFQRNASEFLNEIIDKE